MKNSVKKLVSSLEKDGWYILGDTLNSAEIIFLRECGFCSDGELYLLIVRADGDDELLPRKVISCILSRKDTELGAWDADCDIAGEVADRIRELDEKQGMDGSLEDKNRLLDVQKPEQSKRADSLCDSMTKDEVTMLGRVAVSKYLRSSFAKKNFGKYLTAYARVFYLDEYVGYIVGIGREVRFCTDKDTRQMVISGEISNLTFDRAGKLRSVHKSGEVARISVTDLVCVSENSSTDKGIAASDESEVYSIEPDKESTIQKAAQQGMFAADEPDIQGASPVVHDIVPVGRVMYKCGVCGNIFDDVSGPRVKFCFNCGKRVDWRGVSESLPENMAGLYARVSEKAGCEKAIQDALHAINVVNKAMLELHIADEK